VSEFCRVVPNICRSLVWNFRHVTLLAARILRTLFTSALKFKGFIFVELTEQRILIKYKPLVYCDVMPSRLVGKFKCFRKHLPSSSYILNVAAAGFSELPYLSTTIHGAICPTKIV